MRNKYKGDDLRARLGGTIIRYKGSPYVCNVDGEELRLVDMLTGNTIVRVDPDDPFIDISSLTLGYFNIAKAAVYVTRHPYRRYKQGVSLDSLEYRTLSKNFGYGAQDMYCQGFIDGLNDKFPSLEVSIKKLLVDNLESIAISKEVALKKESDILKVHVKGSEEGWMKLYEKVRKVIVPPSDSSWATTWIIKEASPDWDVVEGRK